MKNLLLVFVVLLSASTAFGHTTNLPPYAEFSATLDSIPQVGVPLRVVGTLTALIGELKDAEISMMPPTGWAIPRPLKLSRIASGSSRSFVFEITPSAPAPVGSILCEARIRLPKKQMIEQYRITSPENGEVLARMVEARPEFEKMYCDVAFSLHEHEGFFPLGEYMWINYDSRLVPTGFSTGPVYYREGMITPYQAQTDIEMFEKLKNLLAADPTLAHQLESTGVDISKKSHDYLLGLYVMATEAYEKGSFQTAASLISRIQSELEALPKDAHPELLIVVGNLKGLTEWATGDRKRAEETIRQTFYRERKHPLQRYSLRNLGLLMLDSGNRQMARQMFQLALQMKPEYSLLRLELDSLAD